MQVWSALGDVTMGAAPFLARVGQPSVLAQAGQATRAWMVAVPIWRPGESRFVDRIKFNAAAAER